MDKEKKKGIVSFSPDDDYQHRIEAAKAKQAPLGHVESPKMPRFDQPPQDRYAGVQGAKTNPAVLSPQQMDALAGSGALRQGVGSAYVANQPHLANQTLPSPEQIAPGSLIAINQDASRLGPQPGPQPRPPGEGLRPETQQMLLEAQMAASKAEAAAKVEAAEEERLKKENDEIENEFEMDGFGNKVRDKLRNKKRRQAIEARCAPMDFEDLLVVQEIRQDVPILPGKLVPTYRSPAGEEDQFVKREMSDVRGSETYIIERFALMNLTTHLHAINGRPLPTHLDNNREVKKELFDAKFKAVCKYPNELLVDLSVNQVWFVGRLRLLTVEDGLKDF